MLGQPTSAAIFGQKKIAVTGTAVQLATNTGLQNGVTIKADKNNSAVLYVGNSNVANTGSGSGNGFELYGGDSISLAVTNLSSLYINGSGNDFVTYAAN